MPTSIAIGIVAATEEVAHGLCFIALTTTRPSTAIRMTMIISTPNSAVMPPTGPISSRAILPSEWPSRRSDAPRITKSWTHPPSTAPITIHNVEGR